MEILPFVTIDETRGYYVKVNEISQSQILHGILICGIKKKIKHIERVEWWLPGTCGVGGRLVKGYKLSVIR